MGLFNLFGKNYRIPHGKTAKEHAQSLLDDVAWYADEINNSRDVFNFCYLWEKLDKTISELIWLNEKKKVKMYPTPRSEWKKILSNLEKTINDFLTRATQFFPAYGEMRAEAIETFLNEVENNDGFYSLFHPANHARIEAFRAEAEAIRQRIAKREAKEAEEQRKGFNLSRLGIDMDTDVSDIDPFTVADYLESKLKVLREYVLFNGTSADESWKIFSDFRRACESSKLPLAAEIRLEDLLKDYEPKFKEAGSLYFIDNMSGHEFEHWCAGLLRKIGFQKVEVTQASGDDGVDIIAEKDCVRYAIQCKCYKSDLGNKPIQEVHTGKSVYHCHVGVVMTNRHFTSGGKRAAEATGTLLWDRNWIIEALKQTNEE